MGRDSHFVDFGSESGFEDAGKEGIDGGGAFFTKDLGRKMSAVLRPVLALVVLSCSFSICAVKTLGFQIRC